MNMALPGLVPTARQTQATVVAHELMAKDTYRLRIQCPEIAGQILPGQFFMVHAPGRTDPLLGRPFALFDVYEKDGQPMGVDFGYVVVGKMTSLMADWKPGQPVELWGPLGNGFPSPDCESLLCVAGGIGQTPFLAVVREALGLRKYGGEDRNISLLPRQVGMYYGVRSADYLAGVKDFTIDGLELRLATDDGSAGHHGFVTDLLEEAIASNDPPDRVYCCGPEPMMAATAKLCAEYEVPCWLSLETPMACGFGACFSCVTRVRQENGGWDYRRTCVEGPVFPAETLYLEEN